MAAPAASLLSRRAPVLFVPHGGGPMPLMGDPGHRELIRFLTQDAPRHLKLPDGSDPAAVLVVTAHWESPTPAISSQESPGLLFDYYGFPEETYHYKWPAPGSPSIAKEAASLLSAAGFKPVLDTSRGNDHGVFVPMKLVLPEPKIPVVQVSVLESFDPEQHLAMGKALAPLRDKGIAIVGSGMSFHNMQAFRSSRFGSGSGPGRNEASQAFDTALTDAVQAEPAARWQLLKDWQRLPKARYSHPREEHLLPLLVCAGAAGDDAGTKVHEEASLGGFVLSGFKFGPSEAPKKDEL
ncbi:Extradiol ring-cleavage dioxygenase, class III enzyme, subunit B [Hyaloraphidium curvatum]|nr:Extradiol ring-cleavage dioxygenase, class III enzyme, subunit B [Hyaloraphidium curvatum]